MRYSLSDYVLGVSVPEDDTTGAATAFGLNVNPLTVGGEGSYTEKISVSLDNDMWSTKADATGSWVHSKNLSKTGKITVDLSLISPKNERFKQLFNVYYSAEDYSGVTLSLTDKTGKSVFTAIDCYVTKIPDHDFEAEPGTLSWIFTCGQITFN